MVYTPFYSPTYQPATTTGTAGQPVTLYLDFYDETSGLLTDPASVELDITYGTEVGLTADVAGPFFYSGASSNTPGQVWRIGTGQYAFQWQIPLASPSGVYVANWTTSYGGTSWLGIENFPVTGGFTPGTPSGDVGYWTGGLIYGGLDIEFGKTDANGITWLWQKLEGWDGPDVTGGLTQRAGDQGAWASPQFYQARTLTWTVTATAPTQALRDTARALLSQALPVSDLALLRYDEPAPKQIQVRRSGKITETYMTLTDVTFSVLLVAPDPRKYSTLLKTFTTTTQAPGSGLTFPATPPLTFPASGIPGGGSLVLVNGGNFETRPAITITGPIDGPALVSVATGQSVSWSTLSLAATDQLAVNFLTQQAFLNGAYRPADPQSSWWTLPAGATTTVSLQSTSNDGATVQAAWRDAWL